MFLLIKHVTLSITLNRFGFFKDYIHQNDNNSSFFFIPAENEIPAFLSQHKTWRYFYSFFIYSNDNVSNKNILTTTRKIGKGEVGDVYI